MAWERGGNAEYYYRSYRAGGHVRKQYVVAGPTRTYWRRSLLRSDTAKNVRAPSFNGRGRQPTPSTAPWIRSRQP